MPLKIGFLTERLLLGFGVDLVVHQYASFLIANSYDVEVYCQRHDMSVPRSYKVVDLSVAGGPTMTDSMSRNVVNFAAFFNGRDIDVWIVNTPPFYDVIPLLARPVIAIEYGTPPSRFFKPEIGRNLDASVSYRFHNVYSRLRPQDKILCISRSIQNWLPDRVRAFSEVLYLGCDHYKSATAGEVQQFRRNLSLDDGVVILWVGRVQIVDDEQPYKGFPEFVELVKRAQSVDPLLQFIVAGRGGKAEADFLRFRNIVPCLNLSDSQMGVAFASSDLLVSTSLWEGFNLPLLEAQAQGTPVLAYAHGPHTEVVRDRETGILADDFESMLAALLALARDADSRESLASNTRAFAAGFSWEKSAKGLEEAITHAAEIAGAAGNAHRPSIDSSRLRTWAFVLEDTYSRFGLLFLLKRIARFACARLPRPLKQIARSARARISCLLKRGG